MVQADGNAPGKSMAGDLRKAVVLRNGQRTLSIEEFARLADVPPEVEWFAGMRRAVEFRSLVRGHVIAWRKTLEQRNLSPATIRGKLSAHPGTLEGINACLERAGLPC